MRKTLKLILIAGARPNFMKVAPLIKACAAYNAAHASDGAPLLSWKLVHTGQHYDEKMSEVFFRELGIPKPDINLEVGSGSHAVQTAQIMIKFEPVCVEEKPDWIVVVGDVNSTMACTLVASKLGIKVAHVEAGLRSRDRSMPEEVNRLVTDALADLLLTPSDDADENLRREGVPDSKIRLVGNVMIDALVTNLPAARRNDLLQRLGLSKKGFAYVTLHRPANVDRRDSLAQILGGLQRLSKRLPVVFPMHPRTRKMIAEFGIPLETGPSFQVLEPIGYLDSLTLCENARIVVTDSGGLQEESTYFRTPCLTLRPNTERPVTITVGSNRLTEVSKLEGEMEQVLASSPDQGSIPHLWDGRTAERVVEALLNFA